MGVRWKKKREIRGCLVCLFYLLTKGVGLEGILGPSGLVLDWTGSGFGFWVYSK